MSATGNVTIGNVGALAKVVAAFRRTAIICDRNTQRHCLPYLLSCVPALREATVIVVPAGERYKSIDTCTRVWKSFLRSGINRHALVVNLGGGVVCDLGGFCAASYMRGVNFVNVPTTLLAMADASVGGKNGVNFEGAKNMIGSFREPLHVFIDLLFLRTLSSRHISNGMAEIFKMALVADAGLWRRLLKDEDVSTRTIRRAVQLKQQIVTGDPYDTGRRQILNFGHTAGHALELMPLHGTLLHGEAVAAGMVIETWISEAMHLIDPATATKVTSAFIARFGHLGRLPSAQSVLNKMHNDKKRKDKLVFSLIDGIGSCAFGVVVKQADVVEAIERYNAYRP